MNPYRFLKKDFFKRSKFQRFLRKLKKYYTIFKYGKLRRFSCNFCTKKFSTRSIKDTADFSFYVDCPHCGKTKWL